MGPSNNYLFFEIRDNDNIVRGNLIGTQHTVERRDRDLNPLIIEAINRSSRAVLEMPPGSKLIPSLTSPEFVIDIANKQLELHPSRVKVIPVVDKQADSLMNDIKQYLAPEDFEEVTSAFQKINSSEGRLVFAKAVLENIAEFNSVSLEENLNMLMKGNENLKIIPLEDIDLGQLIIDVNKKIEQSQSPESVLEPIDEKTKQLNQKIQQELYEAWKKGDTVELKKKLDESHALNVEPKEFEAIHANRDESMAKRVIQVLHETKKEDNEATFIMGCAHLLYSKRKNVLEYLSDSFKSGDLTGWSISQVKVQ